MIAAERTLSIPPMIWLSVLAAWWLWFLVWAEHRWLAPRLIARRHRGR